LKPGREGRGRVVVLGAVNWDVSIFEASFPGPGEEVPVLGVSEGPGGKGANVAVAVARILGPGSVSFVGAVGDDDASRILLSGLEQEGVSTGGVRQVPGSKSGRAYIVVDSRGAKTIHTHFGANDRFGPGDLNEAARDALSSSSVAVVMDLPVEASGAAASMARTAGAEVVYSPGVRAAAGPSGLRRVLGSASVVVVNEAELGRLFPGEGRLRALSRLAEDCPGLAAIETRGPLGCALATEDGSHELDAIDLRSLGLEAVNSTGAGDAFLGAYAAHRLLGLGQRDSVSLAALAGALKATRADTRGSPTKEEMTEAEAKLRKLRQWPRAWRRSRA
jgi:ribokinase